MNIDKAKLRALALAATPDQWVTDGEYVNEHGNVLYAYVAHENSGRIAEAFANCLVSTDEQCRANAAFIAAFSPTTALGLLAEIDQMVEQNENLLECRSSVNAAVARENEVLRKDAERYRWLRNPSSIIVVRNAQCHLNGSRMDEQVDAAMARDVVVTGRRDNQSLTHQASNHSVD
ncbi:ead/Ea22-like family protein [Pseudomonas putida]|nr:ead/Ea22-like family protein [Pseudomonas putida]